MPHQVLGSDTVVVTILCISLQIKALGVETVTNYHKLGICLYIRFQLISFCMSLSPDLAAA
jgi:hypothetical protein